MELFDVDGVVFDGLTDPLTEIVMREIQTAASVFVKKALDEGIFFAETGILAPRLEFAVENGIHFRRCRVRFRFGHSG